MDEIQQQTLVPELSDEEALLKIAQAMKDANPPADEKHNVHTFLFNVVTAKDTTKIGNLQVDKTVNELGIPEHTVRGAKDMQLISAEIMENPYYAGYFALEAENTLGTSLSRDGFLVRQATIQTKQIADVTRRRKVNRGWFGVKNVEESGGDTSKVE